MPIPACMAAACAVPEVYRSLCAAAEQGLRAGIAACKPGVPLREIGAAMERRVRAAGFVPIRNLTCDGIGRELHEAPRHLYCYDHAAEERCAQLGMTLALECFAATFTSLRGSRTMGWRCWSRIWTGRPRRSIP